VRCGSRAVRYVRCGITWKGAYFCREAIISRYSCALAWIAVPVGAVPSFWLLYSLAPSSCLEFLFPLALLSSAERFEGCSMWCNVKRRVFLQGSYHFTLQLRSHLNCCTHGCCAFVLIDAFVGTILSSWIPVSIGIAINTLRYIGHNRTYLMFAESLRYHVRSIQYYFLCSLSSPNRTRIRLNVRFGSGAITKALFEVLFDKIANWTQGYLKYGRRKIAVFSWYRSPSSVDAAFRSL
jgi:hypothetical protein